MMASSKGHKDIAKLLTDKGADLNLQSNVSVPFYVWMYGYMYVWLYIHNTYV